MARNRRGLMSPRLKERLAYELGVADIVQQNGGYWGDVPARQCGSLVRAAIELAERHLAEEELARRPVTAPGAFGAGRAAAWPGTYEAGRVAAGPMKYGAGLSAMAPGAYGAWSPEPVAPPTAAFVAPTPGVAAHLDGYAPYVPY